MDKIAEKEKIAGMGGATLGNDLQRYQNEISRIKKKATVETGKVQVKEIVDHRNISLWTKWGKRIGPLHQANALRTFELFWNNGIQLSTEQPAPEAIAAYWKSGEGKAHKKAHEDKRAVKEKSRKAGQMEKLAKEIAKMSGMTVEAINKVLATSKSLDEGRAKLGSEAPGQNLGGDKGDGVGGVVSTDTISDIKPK